MHADVHHLLHRMTAAEAHRRAAAPRATPPGVRPVTRRLPPGGPSGPGGPAVALAA
ncbi:hypothetical protein [Streptomyces omiyaensis]|uniref:Uncharacterized protein n=1 Tax=Streptomyces omiyaensis TaxID=68247 RepID=A0ABW7BMP9_9ACTN|nr:hypothetical protein [Streptomyces omiyaensis]GGY28930.1 hypothetical protein GCM10010363_06500 [Streptomyces omiyaensis]